MALNTSDKEFLIRVRADIDQAKRDLQSLTKEIRTQGNEAKKQNSAISTLGAGFGGLASAVGSYLTVATALRAARLADEFQALDARIRRATESQADYNRTSQELFDISQRNGVALRDTVSVFEGINRAAGELGATRDQVLAVTEALQQLGRLSGASDVELGNALRQFSQAMSGGVLRAEEFNSIVEQTPEIAVRIARGMGLTVGQLRSAVVEGRVLADDVFQSLLGQTGEIRAEVEQLPTTIDQAFNALANSTGRFLGTLDNALGTSNFIAEGLQGWSRWIDLATDKLEQQASTQGKLAEATERRIQVLRQIQDLEEKIANSSLNQVPALLQNRLDDLRRQAMNLKNEILALTKQAKQEADTGEGETGGTGGGSGGIGGTRTGKSEYQRQQERIQKLIEALQQQDATFGQSSEQVALYRLQMEGASQAQLDQASAIVQSIEAQKALKEEQRLAAEAQKEAERAAQQESDRLDKLAQQWQDQINPINAYQRQLEDLDTLYASGRINIDTYSEATFDLVEAMEKVGEASKETGDEMSEFAKQAARNIQDQLGDTLFNTAKGNFDNMAQAWADMLLRMSSEALAAKLGEKLFGDLLGSGTGGNGWIGDFLASVFQFHDGGIVGQGGTPRQVNPLVFARAPRLHNGGLLPDERPAILQTGEEVLSRGDPRNANNGGGAGAAINNVLLFDREMLGEYMSTAGGRQVLISTISENPADFRAALELT